MAAPSDCALRARIAFCVIGMLVGLSVFIVFGFRYKNWNAALWGLLSGVAALLTLIVHGRYVRGAWQHYPYQLRHWMLGGCFVQLAGVCGIVAYLVLAITQKQGLIIEGPGYYLTVVWCFMTLKWGFLLFFYSRSYRRLYLDIYSILPQDEKLAPSYTDN